MSNREDLAAALADHDKALRPIPPQCQTLAIAAKERLVQLPEQFPPHTHHEGVSCAGKVYPAETVKRIAEAMRVVPFHGEVDRAYAHRVAVAVLDALNGDRA